MYILTLLLGKFIMWASRLAGNNGASLPGYVIERSNKSFLRKGLNRLPQGVVIVTGTNGKTTTTKMIAEGLEALGLRVLTNKSGSNFVRGIIALIVDKSTMGGKLPYDIAVLEQDEAYAAQLVRQYQPRAVVVLNVMRDQMDRFGEINTTASLLEQVTLAAHDFVILNAHDPRVGKLKTASSVSRFYFDVAGMAVKDFPNDDDWHGAEHFKATTHRAPKGDGVVLQAISGSEATYEVDGQTVRLSLKATGTHNFLNAATAIATLRQLCPDAPLESTVQAVAAVEPAFGRGEELQIGKSHIRLQLVKNPAGFMQSLKLLKHQSYDNILLVINDDYADGRDMSWLWDVAFESLKDLKASIVTGGTRGSDMAVRLKYDDIVVKQVYNSDKAALRVLQQSDKSIRSIIFCTYTAMMRIRKELIKQGHVRQVR